MIKSSEDPESEVAPPTVDSSSELKSSEGRLSSVPEHDRESVRQHAEEFVVEWMKGAVQKAKSAIVDKAMKTNPSLIDIASLDKTIIDVIADWDFSVDP